jgi:prepilin-type N-terminal cleavage/methylation domain-containing protein
MKLGARIQHKGAALRRQSGFSLLEVMVVLAIVGLVSLTLVQSLSDVLRARTKLGPYIDQSEDSAKASGWYRQVVNGLMPDNTDGPDVFRAGSAEILGLTLQPLAADVGIPTRFRLSLQNLDNERVALRFDSESGPSFDLLRWKSASVGRKGARFLFFDGNEWYDHWPVDELIARSKRPINGTYVEAPQLPKLIRLDAAIGDQPIVLVAGPRGPLSPLPRITDLTRLR